MKAITGALASLALAAGLLWGASPAGATPPDGSWEFAGSMTAPARSLANVDISVSGTISVTAGLLASVTATKSCDDTHPPQLIPYVQNAGTAAFTAVTNGGLSPTPISAAGTTSISGTANVAPGTYNLVLRFRCTGGANWEGNVAASPPASVSIATVSATSYTTRACIATVPITPCTSSNPPAVYVPSGLQVTFAGMIRRTWSDGAVTETAVDGTQSLRRADVGSGSWTTIGYTCAYTTEVTATYQYRCESGYGTHDAVTVNSMTATSDYLVGTPNPNPSLAVKGASVAISGILHQRYPDNSYWPAPVGTAYTVQFQASGSGSWTAVKSGTLSIAGNYATTFPLPGTGKVRVAAGAQTSGAVDITELAPTSTYEISALSAPSPVAPGSAVSLSATVKAKWSDGEWRNAPDGTTATLEFAQSYDPGNAPATWSAAKQGSVTSGVAAFSTIPQASGFWRITVGTYSSGPAYVAVSGSAPLTLSATMAPAPGQKPFEGTESYYDIGATLSGYVGTQAVTLYVDLGTGRFTKAGQISGGSFEGRVRVAAPDKAGSYAPRFEARSGSGDVLATAAGAPVEVDGIQSYEITARTSDGTVREGANGRVFGNLNAVTRSGRRIAQNWSGTVQLQRSLGGDWATIDSSRASGREVEFTTTALAQASYRIAWVGEGIVSEAVRFQVITPTGVIRFGRVSVDDPRITQGESTRVNAQVQAGYSDGSFTAAPAGTKVLLQSGADGVWKTIKELYTRDGRVVSSVGPKSTTSYRFVLADTTTSKTLTVTVSEERPVRLVINWPQTFYVSVGGKFTGYIETNSGNVWKGSTLLKLQYRISSYEDWKTIGTGTYRGRKFSWGWTGGSSAYVSFRVSAPELGLDNVQKYEPA